MTAYKNTTFRFNPHDKTLLTDTANKYSISINSVIINAAKNLVDFYTANDELPPLCFDTALNVSERITLRVPIELQDEIERISNENNVSINRLLLHAIRSIESDLLLNQNSFTVDEGRSQVALVFPESTFATIQKIADKNKRSTNDVIVSLTQAAISQIKSGQSQDMVFLQQNECLRITSMYRQAIESQYNLVECYEKGYWGMDAFIPLGDDRYAFINHKDQVVWAYEGEFDTDQHYFVPSQWNLETGNWEGLDFEHPAIMHDLEVIDASHFQPQPNSTPKI